MGFVEAILGRISLKGVAVFGAAAWLLYIILSYVDKEIRLRRLPGTRAKPLLGNMSLGLDFTYHSIRAALRDDNFNYWRTSLEDKPAWTAEATVLGMRLVMTADVENIKAILATQFGDYGKGEPFHEEWHEFLGDSIFTTDGQQWHDSRQLLRPQFIRDRVSDLNCFESHIQTLFRVIDTEGGNGGAAHGKVLDISDLLFRYTLDVATDFLLGMDVKSLLEPKQEFAEAFTEVQRVQSIITRSGKVRPLVPRGSFRRGLRVVNSFVNTYIEGALRLSPAELEKKTKAEDGGATGGADKYTFLHALAGFTRDRTVLRDQIVAVLLAGRDTTAATLSWAFYELGRHPAAVARLRAEILDTVGPGRAPTYDDLKSMKYLQAVLSETLRLYPAVPFNMRLALRDTTLPRGGGPDGRQPVAVLKDTPIVYSTLVMQRRPDIYPALGGDGKPLPDPAIFAPERWASGRWQPKPWEYIPFNGGPRICIGQQFALTEMGYVLVRLFQRFERVENRMADLDGGQPRMKADIVLQPGQGVKVALWEAKGQW